MDILRDGIPAFHLKPWERPGVGRTVVRESLRHLEPEGCVALLCRQGPAVVWPGLSRAAQAYGSRALLDAEASRAAAPRARPADLVRPNAASDAIQELFPGGPFRGVLKATAVDDILFTVANK